MKINYKPFENQTSSDEDLYLFAFEKLSLNNLLTHYDPAVRKESYKLKRLGAKSARKRVRRHFLGY
jgi:hypothetical protein